ncbi:MAG: DUF4019 domain-containing protein [Casimicrobiaceae bacterium]
MSLRRGLILALACALLAGPAPAAEPAAGAPAATGAAAEPQEAAAIAAATDESDRWLALLAHGKYADSWVAAAVVLQEAIAQKTWVDDLAARQAKLGRLIMRERKTASYSKIMRGAPTGDYVTVTYLTKFEKAPLVDETLAVAKDSLGQWHVAGYDIALDQAKSP